MRTSAPRVRPGAQWPRTPGLKPCDPEQAARPLCASAPLPRRGDDDATDLAGWLESARRQLSRDTHLQADEGEGDAVPAEVLQEPRQRQHHGVVGAADVGAVQHGAARAGCCGRRRVPLTPAPGPRLEAQAERGHRELSAPAGRGQGARGDSSSCLLPGEGWPFPSGRRKGSSGVSVGEQPPSPHEDKGRSLEGGGTPGHRRRPRDTLTSRTRGASSALTVEGRALGCRRSRPGAEGAAVTPALAHVPSRARLAIASRRASTAGKCRPLASCTTSTGPSDTCGQRWRQTASPGGESDGAALPGLGGTGVQGCRGPSPRPGPRAAGRVV